MAHLDLHRLTVLLLLILIPLVLFSVIEKPKCMLPVKAMIITPKTSKYNSPPPDPKMREIYVPPVENSHPKCCSDAGRLCIPNTWNNLPPDNNIPGLLPGPRHGEDLGLINDPNLDLRSPIRSPLTNPTQQNLLTNNTSTSPKFLSCLNEAIRTSQVPTLTSEQYYRLRFQQCNPYNGSYCQCTNNYIPLPTSGYCQPYNRGMEVCPYPYKVADALLYKKAQECTGCVNPA